jgi:hypothetical protein
VTDRRIPKSILLPKPPNVKDPELRDFLLNLIKVMDRRHNEIAREVNDHEDRITVLEP